MKKKILLAFFLCFAFLLQAQEEFVSGLDLEGDEALYEELPREAQFDGSKDRKLPFKVDLSPYCPMPGDQGKFFSCVGWSVGYGAMTIQKAQQNDWKDKQMITANANSALFIYNQIKKGGDCQKGSRISDAMKFLSENGNVLDREFQVKDCSVVPESELQEKAKENTIEDFLTLFSAKEKPNLKILKAKQALARNKPVIIGMKVLRNFYLLKEAKYWHPKNGNTTAAGGHAMVLVGYDESKKAFHLFNSWGAKWGDKGFIWVKYKDFGEYCKYAYQMHKEEEEGTFIEASLLSDRSSRRLAGETTTSEDPSEGIEEETTRPNKPRIRKKRLKKEPLTESNTWDETTEESEERTEVIEEEAPVIVKKKRQANIPQKRKTRIRKLAGSFAFKVFTGWSETEKPIFKTPRVEFDGAAYRTVKEVWPTGKKFQLWATSRIRNRYVYVFSIDAESTVNIHWPRSQNLNSKFEGVNESAFVPDRGSRVIVPGKNKVLKLVKAGTDRLIVLYSSRKIRDIKEISQKVALGGDDYIKSLYEILGLRMVPLKSIKYNPERIGFTARTKTKGHIVPLILEVESE